MSKTLEYTKNKEVKKLQKLICRNEFKLKLGRIFQFRDYYKLALYKTYHMSLTK